MSPARALPRALWAALVGLLGCTDRSTVAPPSDDDTISLSGYIFTVQQSPDLRIAAFDLPEVVPATPDDEGVFTLTGIPRGQAFVLQSSGQGLVPTLQQVPPSDEDIYGYRASAPRVGGTTYPEGLAADQADLLVQVQRDPYRKDGLALAQIVVTPDAAQAPDYLNDGSATGLSGRALLRGVAPPEVQLEIETDRPCVAPAGWEGDTDPLIRVPVAPGHLTLVEAVCADPKGDRLVQGVVSDSESSAPIADAELCVGASNCTTTNEIGVYQLEIADGQDRVLSQTAAGYVPLQRALTNEWEASGTLSIRAMAVSTMEQLVATAGTTQASDLGLLWIRANGSGWDASLTPAPGDGVIYFDGTGTPDADLPAATIAGDAIAPNVEPGQVALDLSHPGLDCRATTAWEWSADPVQLPVAAGTVTDVRAVCFPAATE